jgi:glycosyltransferase involved in cell wall biosynthesis
MAPAVHLVFTEVLTQGGVQRYSAQLAKAVDLAASELGWNVKTFSLNDPDTSAERRGFGGDKRALVTSLLASARRDRPEVVIFGHTNLAPLVMGYRAVSFGTRSYVIAHGLEVESAREKSTLAGLFAATGVLAVSTSTRSFLQNHHLPRRKVGVLRYGFSDGIAADGTAPRGDGPLRLLSVSRLTQTGRHKGIDVTIQALGLLKAELPDAEYVVVGNGDDRARLEWLSEACGVQERVHMRGRVSDEQLQAEYRQCDVFVLPSTHEGLGIVYLEAMAHAKPIIAVHAGGVADAVVHEMNGLLVQQSSPAEVAGAVRRLAMEPALRTRLGRWGREFSLPSFSFERMVDNVSALLVESARNQRGHAKNAVVGHDGRDA